MVDQIFIVIMSNKAFLCKMQPAMRVEMSYHLPIYRRFLKNIAHNIPDFRVSESLKNLAKIRLLISDHRNFLYVLYKTE
jgi:hypothetical protein